MAAVTLAGMRAMESSAMALGWTEESLLDLAGTRLGIAIGRFFPRPGLAIGYLGKGHNAGDTIVALGVLRDRFGWKIESRSAFPITECAHLTREKWWELGAPEPLTAPPEWMNSEGPILLLDGLLGTGTKGALRAPLLGLSEEMEWLRNHAGAQVAAVDLPTGIDADTGETFPGCVTADATFMIGNAKCGLLTGRAANAAGALILVPVEVLTSHATGEIELIAPQTVSFGKSPRPFDFHKGMAGRVAVLAGSEAYTGAAVLAATGALRGGGGLVTLHVPKGCAGPIASRCPPEIIVREYSSPGDLGDQQFDSLVAGCGIGTLLPADARNLLDLMAEIQVPTVIDADALNLLAAHGKISILNDRHVITPHPGEFRRLAPDLTDLPREQAARVFADRTASTLLLKGSRTIVTRNGQPLYCNATGNPGMATGGQGDLLAGVIGARLAMGDSPLEAAALAAWVCGRSAERVLNDPSLSEESLTPSDVAENLGGAFRDWKLSLR